MCCAGTDSNQTYTKLSGSSGNVARPNPPCMKGSEASADVTKDHLHFAKFPSRACRKCEKDSEFAFQQECCILGMKVSEIKSLATFRYGLPTISIGRIKDIHTQCVGSSLDEVGDIEGEPPVSTSIVSGDLVIDIDSGLIIDGLKVDEDSVALGLQVLRHFEVTSEPRCQGVLHHT